jgi:Ca2+-binding RTX toxin-like protein
MRKIATDFQIFLPTYIPTSTTGYLAQKSGAYYLASGDTLSYHNGVAFSAADTAAGLGLTVAGTIDDSDNGINLNGTAAIGDTIHVTSAGVVKGTSVGIEVIGANDTIVNNGLVKSASISIGIEGPGQTLTNNGSLVGGVATAGDGTVIYNHGTIVGLDGVLSNVASGETLKFFNSGSITGSAFAYFSAQGGADEVHNSGTMNGDVVLGSGQDVFANSGGTVDGKIFGGGGDDMFIIDDKSLKIVENANEGWDTEKSSVSFTVAENVEEGMLLGKQDLAMTGSSGNDLLYGNKGDNHIAGDLGQDHIVAGTGNDTLTGGVKGASGDGSQDIFIFGPHSGSDIITDFEAGTDKINLGAHGGFGSYADLKSHIHQMGSDVVIDLTDGDKITVQDMQKADLHAGDFIF